MSLANTTFDTAMQSAVDAWNNGYNAANDAWTAADVAATDVFNTAVQAADDAWNTAASGAEAAYDRATVAADQAWTDAEATAWGKYTAAVNDLESAYQAAIDDALAAWTTATKDAETVWNAAQTDAENEFISDATAAIDDYISRITTAIDNWTTAETNAQNAFDFAIKTAIDAWNTSETAAQLKYDTAMSLALSKWNATNDTEYAIYSTAYDNALSLTDTSLSLTDTALSLSDDDLSFVCYVDPSVPAAPETPPAPNPDGADESQKVLQWINDALQKDANKAKKPKQVLPVRGRLCASHSVDPNSNTDFTTLNLSTGITSEPPPPSKQDQVLKLLDNAQYDMYADYIRSGAVTIDFNYGGGWTGYNRYNYTTDGNDKIASIEIRWDQSVADAAYWIVYTLLTDRGFQSYNQQHSSSHEAMSAPDSAWLSLAYQEARQRLDAAEARGDPFEIAVARNEATRERIAANLGTAAQRDGVEAFWTNGIYLAGPQTDSTGVAFTLLAAIGGPRAAAQMQREATNATVRGAIPPQLPGAAPGGRGRLTWEDFLAQAQARSWATADRLGPGARGATASHIPGGPAGLPRTPITMDQALELALQNVGEGASIVRSGSGSFQFISEYTNAAGHRITVIARFDINPASPHVRGLGPHLNLETQINGNPIRTGELEDPHIPITPDSWKPGDIP